MEVGVGEGEEAEVNGSKSADAEEGAGKVNDNSLIDPIGQGGDPGEVGAAWFGFQWKLLSVRRLVIYFENSAK